MVAIEHANITMHSGLLLPAPFSIADLLKRYCFSSNHQLRQTENIGLPTQGDLEGLK